MKISPHHIVTIALPRWIFDFSKWSFTLEVADVTFLFRRLNLVLAIIPAILAAAADVVFRMICCTRYCAAEAQFDRNRAKRDLERYRRRGADPITRLLLTELRNGRCRA